MCLLLNRSAPAEVTCFLSPAKVEATVAALTQEVRALAERVSRLSMRPKRVQENKINKHDRMHKWWQRIEAGEPKATEINTILIVAGIRIITVAEMSLAYSTVGKNETRSIQAVEELFDRHGAEGLAQVANILVQLEPDGIRLPYVEAIEYALFNNTRPLHSDAIFLNAVDYFHMPWAELETKIAELRTRVSTRTRGELIGKLITKEVAF